MRMSSPTTRRGVTNIKLFEKIHEADAHTIADLMAYVDSLVDTQEAVMHDFNEQDHDDGGSRSRKRSGEAYMIDLPRPSTFLEGDYNMFMDDQCQFHYNAKHTMRECEQMKRALGVPPNPRRPRAATMMTRMATNTSTTIIVDRIDAITVTVGPIVATTIGIDMIIVVTTAAMTDAITIVIMIATTGAMTARVIAVTTSTVTDEMIDVMITAARMTTTATITTARSDLHPYHLTGATLTVRFNQPTERSISSSAAAKRPKATGSSDQTQGRSGTSTLKLHSLCVGRSS
jgi:hypothetical protein